MNADQIVNEILESKKYSGIDASLVKRVCLKMITRYVKKKDVIKAVKNELHIIHESFLVDSCHKIARAELAAYKGMNLIEDKAFSLQIMDLHISTKERIAYADEIFSYLDGFIDSACTVLDIGCGFNPFALPFYSQLPQRYLAYEINHETVDVLNLYFQKIGQETFHAEILDATATAPADHGDIIFIHKLLPLLQQQKKGRAFELIEELNFDKAIVSFPIKSLSGREKGMEKFYSTFFENGLPERFQIIDKAVIGNEMFYVIK